MPPTPYAFRNTDRTFGRSSAGRTGGGERLGQQREDGSGLGVGVAVGGGQDQLGRRRGLVGIVDAGEAGDLAGPRLGVEALGVALLALLDGRVDEDLDERDAVRVVRGAGPVAAGPVRADERDDGHDAGVGEQPGDLAGPADVLVAVGGGEAEVGVEAVAQVVPVEPVGRASRGHQQPLERDGHGRLARARQAGQPHGGAERRADRPPRPRRGAR